MTDFEIFRTEYGEFVYDSFVISENEAAFDIQYNFEIPGLVKFNPTWSFPKKASSIDKNDALFRKLVFHLGLVELVSYYKCICAKTITVKCGFIDDEDRQFYRKLYYNGLGEFFYRNNIAVALEELFVWNIENKETNGLDVLTTGFCEKMLLNSEKQPVDEKKLVNDLRRLPKVLVPVGGGKDSVVTLESLKDKAEITTFSINRSNAIKRCVDLFSEKKNDYIAERKLDRKIVELNSRGFLNGHTPFSAIVAFSSLIAAYLSDCDYIALSNESSANESTVKGLEVNHQYSKSLEFENDFRRISCKLQENVTYSNENENANVSANASASTSENRHNIEYFSYLRNLSEIMIAERFSKLEKYHKAFLSCNLGTKDDHWCCECGKCLFVYIILSPFISKENLKEIFGEDLLEKESLSEDFEKIIGIKDEKPFECVGTRNEALSALKSLLKNGRKDLLLTKNEAYIMKNAPDLEKLLGEYSEENNIPVCFAG